MNGIDISDLEKITKDNYDAQKHKLEDDFKSNQPSSDSSKSDELNTVSKLLIYLLISVLIAAGSFVISLFFTACFDRLITNINSKVLVNSSVLKAFLFLLELGAFGFLSKSKLVVSLKSRINNYFSKKKMNAVTALVIFMIVLSFVLYNFNCFYTFANSAVDFVFSVNAVSEVNSPSTVNSGVPNENGQNNEVYGQNMTFIIENYNYDEKIDALKSEVLFYGCTESEIINEIKFIYSNGEKNSKRSFPLHLQFEEDKFLNRVCAEGTVITKEIYDSLPYESELLGVINDEYDYAMENMNYLYSERISNLYQKLALEYHRQGASENTIMYYYLKSAQFDLISISCAKNNSDYSSALDRIKTRYSDINYCCKDALNEDEAQTLKVLYNIFDGLYKQGRS